MWAVVGKFGLEPGLRAVWASLLCVGGVGGAHVQRAGLAGGTGCMFAGPNAPQAQADRINVLLRLEHGSVMEGDPPQPGVVNLSGTEFGEPPQEPSFSMHLTQPVLNARVNAGTRLGARRCSSPSPSS